MLAAERLFADRGPDVSLRDIGSAAGNGNNSAVQYHFGSKVRLVRAIFEYRMPRIHARRAMLIAERQPDDVYGWVDCEVRSILEQGELEGSHYLGFVAMLRQHGRRGRVRQPAAGVPRDDPRLPRPALGLPLRHPRAAAHPPDLAGDVPGRHGGRGSRTSRARDDAMLPFAVEVGDLIDATVGFLTARVSTRTMALLGDAPPDVGWIRFL